LTPGNEKERARQDEDRKSVRSLLSSVKVHKIYEAKNNNDNEEELIEANT
jgi:hypothetical protein